MGPLITLNLDGTERQLHSDLWRLWLQPDEPEPEVVVRVRVNPDAAIRWEELDRLPALVELHYQGRDLRLPEYLARRPQIQRLGWSGHGQPRLDLSGTSLAELSLECGEQPLEVLLPASGTLRRLALALPANQGALRVQAPSQGAGIYLMAGCQNLTEGPYAVPGLERLRALSLFNVREARLERLLPYRELEELTLIGPPGAIPDLERLAEFSRLRQVNLRECYALNTRDLPSLSAFPALERVEVDGIRQADAAVLSQHLAGLPGLSIRGKRTDAWLRANLGNAFREWPEDYGAAVGKAAMSAYRQAALALERAGKQADAGAVRAALEKFVAGLNRLSTRQPFDTIQREQAADAYDELAATVTELVPLATMREWFDEWEEL